MNNFCDQIQCQLPLAKATVFSECAVVNDLLDTTHNTGLTQRTVQGRPKPWRAGFENVTHQVPPPYYSVCCHSSWITRSKQLALVRWGSCADVLKKELLVC